MSRMDISNQRPSLSIVSWSGLYELGRCRRIKALSHVDILAAALGISLCRLRNICEQPCPGPMKFHAENSPAPLISL